jgi:predicted nucleic acid-binding protein
VAAVLEPALAAQVLWTCPPIELEVLFSARSRSEYDAVRDDRNSAYRQAPLMPDIGVVAQELQSALAAAGRHRAAGPVDLLIAATAVYHGLTVLHYDSDFELIADVDRRVEQRWVVPRGSVN